MNHCHSISATSLTWLYHDCPRCFWLDRNKVWNRPFTPIPSVLNQIDGLLRKKWDGQEAQKMHPSLPSGRISTQRRRLKTVPIAIEGCQHPVIFSGEIDCLIEMDKYPGYVGIVDWKTAELTQQKLDYYSPQLYTYMELLRHPVNPKDMPKETQFMGFVGVYPELVGSEIRFKNTWHEVKLDKDYWMSFIQKAILLLEGPEPPAKGNCIWCKLYDATKEVGDANS